MRTRNAGIQLFQCALDKLSNVMLANNFWLMSENYVAKLMESVVLIKVAIGVKSAELMGLHQDHNKFFRTFSICVHSKSETCHNSQ